MTNKSVMNKSNYADHQNLKQKMTTVDHAFYNTSDKRISLFCEPLHKIHYNAPLIKGQLLLKDTVAWMQKVP